MKFFLSILFFLLLNNTAVFAQDIFGKWKTVDENTGEQKSVIEIYKNGNKVFGKIIEIKNPNKRDDICDLCTGKDKGKPLQGFVLIKNLVKDGDEYDDGEITNPNTGKTYKCYLTLEEPNKLKVRGYMGFSLIGRTQYWLRVE